MDVTVLLCPTDPWLVVNIPWHLELPSVPSILVKSQPSGVGWRGPLGAGMGARRVVWAARSLPGSGCSPVRPSLPAESRQAASSPAGTPPGPQLLRPPWTQPAMRGEWACGRPHFWELEVVLITEPPAWPCPGRRTRRPTALGAHHQPGCLQMYLVRLAEWGAGGRGGCRWLSLLPQALLLPGVTVAVRS